MKKRNSIGICALSLLLIAAGCQNKSSENGQTAEASTNAKKEPVQIEYWQANGGEIGKILSGMIDQFNQSQNEVFVKEVYQESDATIEKKLLAGLISNVLPDVLDVHSRTWPVFAYNDALLPLNHYIQTDKSFQYDDLIPGFVEKTEIDGNIYTIPYKLSTPLLYYNKDVAKEIGLDPEKPVQTWDELREAAKKAAVVKDGKVKRYGFAVDLAAYHYYSPVWSNGGQILSADNKTVLFDTPAAAKGLQLWADMVFKDKSMMPPAGGLALSGSNAVGESPLTGFVNGRVAFLVLSGANFAEARNSAKFQVGAAFVPKFVDYAIPSGGRKLAIVSKSSKEKQDAAWKFIKYLTAKEQSMQLAQKTGYVPIRESVIQSPEIQAFYKNNPELKVSVDQLKYTRSTPPVEQTSLIESSITKAIEKTLVENTPAEKTLKEAADAVRKAINK